MIKQKMISFKYSKGHIRFDLNRVIGYQISGHDIDIYLPDYDLTIEFDADKEARDAMKYLDDQLKPSFIPEN